MVDLSRTEGKNPQVASTQREKERVRQPLVHVRIALLRELKDFQEHLEAYITGYIASGELYDLCEKVEARLRLGNRDSYRLGDEYYWEDIRDWLVSAQEKSSALKPLFRKEFEQYIQECETNLTKLRASVSDPLRNPQGADTRTIIIDGMRTIKQIKGLVEHINLQSKYQADEVLDKIKEVIHRIFEWIDFSSEQISEESRQQKVGYEAETLEEIAGRMKPPPVLGEGPTLHADAKDRSR